ncbi:MAG: hypothetical protein QOH88_2860 [Verrucomicrobiota bacterium]
MLSAQTPIPIVVPAATPAVTTKAPASAAPEKSGSMSDVLKILEAMKAANEETLKKQAETLQLLDDVEKAADQIRIYTKRS